MNTKTAPAGENISIDNELEAAINSRISAFSATLGVQANVLNTFISSGKNNNILTMIHEVARHEMRVPNFMDQLISSVGVTSIVGESFDVEVCGGVGEAIFRDRSFNSSDYLNTERSEIIRKTIRGLQMLLRKRLENLMSFKMAVLSGNVINIQSALAKLIESSTLATKGVNEALSTIHRCIREAADKEIVAA